MITCRGMLGLLGLTACAAVPHDLPQDPRVESREAFRNLAVTALHTGQQNGFLTVQAEVSNFSGSEQRLYYRFRWLDPNGLEVGDEEAWKVVVVQPLDKKVLSTVALRPQARDFRLVVQYSETAMGPSYRESGQGVGGVATESSRY